ncbi:L,D-transpeptidase family protein [Alteromonas sp. ASW11-19]|uniref:L,D-transpeptidase family protein n=1 Tax=Alteromonas salexigens TaxID=2982530 RepID=A0ABT2VP58_9ALTE|nr:L,D-transpeptidase family protein [Alteromonas salexigens]MCU7554880.1 L,D-transpeptidase family protein [Alteromonas salexigens]
MYLKVLLASVAFTMAFATLASQPTPEERQLLWFNHAQPSVSAMELTSLMADLGLRTSSLLNDEELKNIEHTDEHLTQSLLAINHVIIGHQLNTTKLTYQDITAAHAQGTLSALIDGQLPQFPEVMALRRAITKMRRLSQTPWPTLPDNFTPKLGQRHQHIAALVAILVRLGDYRLASPRLWNDYTPQVQQAIKRFQHRHSLPANGKLNKETRKWLALPPARRLAILQQNLYRWLSMPAVPPEQYVVVNIPEFTLAYRQHGHTLLTMPVIVGAPATPTPIMVTEIDRITVNPQWVPPASIVINELLPQVAASPGLLASQNFHWVSRKNWRDTQPVSSGLNDPRAQYRTHLLVQGPGSANALGKWRFNIKNNDAIYLHDTPVKHLFSRANRALSHGCVRLAAPDKLATLLDATIQPVSLSAATHHRRLTHPVPTYLNYQTVVEQNGQLHWLQDIYHLDDSQFRYTVSQLSATERNLMK